MAMELKKDPGRKKNGPKPIKETKASKPENRFTMDDIKIDKNDGRKTKSQSLSADNGNGRRTYEKGGKATSMVRVSVNTLSRLNSLKMVMGLYSQDDVISRAVNLLVDELNPNDRRYYNILLEVEKRKNNR